MHAKQGQLPLRSIPPNTLQIERFAPWLSSLNSSHFVSFFRISISIVVAIETQGCIQKRFNQIS